MKEDFFWEKNLVRKSRKCTNEHIYQLLDVSDVVIILLSIIVLEVVVWIILHIKVRTGVHGDVFYALYLAVGKVDL